MAAQAQPQFSLASQLDMYKVLYDSDSKTWLLGHRVTQEVKPIPAPQGEDWELNFDQLFREAYVDDGAEAKWVTDLLKLDVYEDQQGEKVINAAKQTGKPISLQRHLVRHSSCNLTLPVGANKGLVTFGFAAFARRMGARVWWNLHSLYQGLGLQCKKTAAKWVQDSLKRWDKVREMFGLEGIHLRRAAPINESASAGSVETDRILRFPAVTTHMLLALCSRWAGVDRALGGLQSEREKTSVREFMGSLFSYVMAPASVTIGLRIDTKASWNPPLPVSGNTRTAMNISNGVVDVQRLRVGLCQAQVDGNNDAAAFLFVIGEFPASMGFMEMFYDIAEKGKKAFFFLQQLVWAAADYIDVKLSFETDKAQRKADEAPATASRAAPPAPKPGVTIAEAFPDTPAGRADRVLHYWQAGRRYFDGVQFASVSVDISRVGGKSTMLVCGAKPSNVVMRDYRGAAQQAVENQDPEALAAEARLWQLRSRLWLKRRNMPEKDEETRVRKRFRAKAYAWCLALDNALRSSWGIGLSYFRIPDSPADRRSAWHWPRLQVAPDQGSDGLAGLAYLKHKGVNVEETPDTSHGVWRDVQLSLKQANIWPWFLLSVASFNVFHGPWEEDRFFVTAKQAMEEYLSVADFRDDPLFNYYMPYILQDMQMSERAGEDKIAQEVWEVVRSSACFAKKGSKVAMSRFFGAFYRFRHDEDQYWHVRLLGLLYWGISTGKFGKAKMDKIFERKAPITVNEAEGAASIAAGDQQLKDLRALCDNGLHLASVMYSDGSNLRRWRLVDGVTAPLNSWHSQQNKTLRSCDASRQWLIQQCSGAFFTVLAETVEVLRAPALLHRMGFRFDKPANPPDLSESHPMVVEEDDFAQLAFSYAMRLIGNRLKRCLWITEGWPVRFVLLASEVDDFSARRTLEAFKTDYERYQELRTSRGIGKPAILQRSLFRNKSVEQWASILLDGNWMLTRPLRMFADACFTSILSSQIVEDGFHLERRAEKRGRNKRVAAMRAYDTLIKGEVLHQNHKYDRLAYKDEVVPRNTKFPDKAFHAIGRDESMPLAPIVGHSQATSWYSPGASSLPQRFADLAILRESKAHGDIKLATDTMWTAFADSVNIMIRKKTPGSQWMFGLGALATRLAAMGWPATPATVIKDKKPDDPDFFQPASVTDKVHWIIVFDLKEWEGRRIEAKSPLNLRLRFGDRYDPAMNPGVVVEAMGGPQDLVKLAAHEAFWQIPKASLVRLAQQMDSETTIDGSSSLFMVVHTLIKDILGCSDEEATELAAKRTKVPPVGLDDLLATDAVEEMMEHGDKDEFKKAKKDAISRKKDRDEFNAEVAKKRTAARAAAKARSSRNASAPAGLGRKRTVKVEGELSQAEVQALAPPGARVWRSAGGTWQIHLSKEFPRFSRSWHKYGEREAAILVLRGAWMQLLEAKGLTEAECPVRGLF